MNPEVYIGWTGGAGWISKMIQRFDPSGHGTPAAINHVLLRFDWGYTYPSWIYESHGSTGIAPTPYAHLKRAIQTGKVTRYIEKPLALEPDQVVNLWDKAVSLHGSGYDHRLIALYALQRSILKGRGITRRNRPDKYTCNEFVTAMLRGIVPEIGVGITTELTPELLFQRWHGVSSADHIAYSS